MEGSLDMKFNRCLGRKDLLCLCTNNNISNIDIDEVGIEQMKITNKKKDLTTKRVEHVSSVPKLGPRQRKRRQVMASKRMKHIYNLYKTEMEN